VTGRSGVGTRTPVAEPSRRATTPPSGTRPRRTPHNPWLARLESPLAAYYLVLGSTVALSAIGLVMVLSSSSVESLRATHMQSSYAIFAKQASFAAAALPVAWVASRLPRRFWTAMAWPLLLVGFGGLLLVLGPLGYEVLGNRNWIEVGGFTLQPSEAAKLSLIVWGAAVLERKRPMFDRPIHVLVPVVPVAAAMLGLVLWGDDLGTALIMIGIVASLLWVAGAPLRAFGVAAGAAAPVVLVLAVTKANRMARIDMWLSGQCTDVYGSCLQTLHGKWALATGGWWGVGLGASRQKWSWLPEAHNDFIFAIIGEELGLAGTLTVLALFALLGFGLFRLVLTSDDMFVKVATGGVLVWVLGQAVVNVGAVIEVLPVIGVPLPLVSSGGSALMMTLIALGMVLGFARRVPGAPEALASRPGVVRRSLAVLPARRQVRTLRHRSSR
jgi:cell division protein FtsW